MSRKKNEHFSGYFDLAEIIGNAVDAINENNSWGVYITRVLYNNPATIVFWNDGLKTISKCSGTDVYNPQIGLLLAVLKRFGKVNRILDDWSPVDENQNVVNVSDVRARNR